MIEMTPEEFFERFGHPDTWEPLKTGDVTACGEDGVIPVADMSVALKDETVRFREYLRAKGSGRFDGSWGEWKDLSNKADPSPPTEDKDHE